MLAPADGREEAIRAAMQPRWRGGFGTASGVQVLTIATDGLPYAP